MILLLVFIHALIRHLQHLAGGITVSRVLSIAHADVNVQWLKARQNRLSFHISLQPLANLFVRLKRKPSRYQDDEFIAPHPIYLVHLPYSFFHALSGLRQHLIPGIVSVLIVNLLKMIQIEED